MPYINQAGGAGSGKIANVTIAGTAASGDVPVASSSTNGTWAFPPGHELDYVQITAPVTVTATADGNSGGTAVIDGGAVTYDGSTRVKIEFYAPAGQAEAGTNDDLVVNLYDGTTDLGRICLVNTVFNANAPGAAPLYGCRFLTPTAVAHTYHIRAWKTAAGVTATVVCGAGGASTAMPAWYRITTT